MYQMSNKIFNFTNAAENWKVEFIVGCQTLIAIKKNLKSIFLVDELSPLPFVKTSLLLKKRTYEMYTVRI